MSLVEDSRLILMRIVSRIWTCFRNQNRTIVAQMAMILANLILCTLWPCHWEGGSWYKNGPQPMA